MKWADTVIQTGKRWDLNVWNGLYETKGKCKFNLLRKKLRCMKFINFYITLKLSYTKSLFRNAFPIYIYLIYLFFTTLPRSSFPNLLPDKDGIHFKIFFIFKKLKREINVPGTEKAADAVLFSHLKQICNLTIFRNQQK